MKFKLAVGLSMALHGLLFALVLRQPAPPRGGMTYYVDLIELGGGSGNRRPAGGATLATPAAASVKKLAVEKPPPASPLRYPSAEGRRQPEESQRVTVVRKPLPDRPPEPTPAPGGEGGLSTGISSGGAGTGEGGIGSGGAFPYAYYVDLLRNRISASWYSALVPPGLRGRLLTTVYFVIQRNGRVADLRVEKPSGSEALDLSALRAVSEAAPFAPLPDDFPSGYLVVHFEFEWEKK